MSLDLGPSNILREWVAARSEDFVRRVGHADYRITHQLKEVILPQWGNGAVHVQLCRHIS
jgi:hypothetical protein